jgi:hypothetical protein
MGKRIFLPLIIKGGNVDSKLIVSAPLDKILEAILIEKYPSVCSRSSKVLWVPIQEQPLNSREIIP